MTVLQNDLIAEPRTTPAARAATPGRRWLFHPVVDVLCLGGASLLVLPILWWLVPDDQASRIEVAAIAVALAHIINHPHFAHSYQIFYGGFWGKAFGAGGDPALQWRYRVAGLIVPLALGGFLLGAALARDTQTLGYAGNLMFLLVGWHYAKQGYGMAIVDSVLKRRFYEATDKRALLAHAYLCWGLAWMIGNRQVAMQNLWGLKYATFAVPDWMFWTLEAAVVASGLWLLWRLGRRLALGKGLPWTGLLAYAVTLYLWLIFVGLNPLFIFVVPAFHSLQYLVVVWRYKLNEAAARPAAPAEQRFGGITAFAWLRLVSFLAVGILLGWALFWGLPQWLDGQVGYDKRVFGGYFFLFAFWIFVNVHHYFLDSVMWRRENPLAKRYLFGG